MIYKIYTDGSSNQGSELKGNRNGGWAFLIVGQDMHTLCECAESEINFTNNQSELMAVIKSIKKFKELALNGTAEIYSDSAYVVNAFAEGWIDNWMKTGWLNAIGEPVANKEMWIELLGLIKETNARILKIKRRSNVFSKRVDDLARAKMRS